MKKILILAGVLALSGAGSAFAIGGIMDIDAGYSYNTAADGIHGGHLEIKPIPKLAIGAEYRHCNNRGDETDIYAKYKIGNIYVGAGSLDAYAGLLVSGEERQYKAGLQLDIVPTSFDLDVNYTYYDRDDIDNEGGIGFGLNYHF